MANAANWWTCYTAILDAELFERHRGQDSSVEFAKALSGRLSTSEKKTWDLPVLSLLTIHRCSFN